MSPQCNLSPTGDAKSYPLWKVFCSGVPLYRGRLESMVTPGPVAGHVHKVMGGNRFSEGVKNQPELDLYDMLHSYGGQ